ncbi:MAG: hypothetical protein LUD69_02035, partial [Oscillospiraceae bacterium]|nr:hypothetical protein [Oscillospiraceae bacterium]
GLRRDYGLPLLPPSAPGALTLTFRDGPVLEDTHFSLAGVELPPCDTLPLLAALWEGGRLKLEDVRMEFTPPGRSSPPPARSSPRCAPPPGGGWASS